MDNKRIRITSIFIIIMLSFNIPFALSLSHTQDKERLHVSPYNEWKEYPLYSLNDVPKGVIALIICRNGNVNTELYGGVRTKGSSIDRRVLLHEAEGDGLVTAAMLVKTDPIDGKIELFQETIKIEHELVGYFEDCDFTETFIQLGETTGEWSDVDLSVHGVPKNATVQVLGWNDFEGSPQPRGVRANGSILERYIELDEAEDGGKNCLSFIVKADVDSIIEVRGDAGNYILLGWFSANVDFIEGFNEYNPGIKEDSIWVSKTLTEPPNNSIVVFALLHEDSGSDTWCGLRKEGSSLNRYIWEHEAEGGGLTGFQIFVTLDIDKKCEIYCQDSSEAHFCYMGYFMEKEIEIVRSVWIWNFMLIFLLSIASIWLYGVSRRK